VAGEEEVIEAPAEVAAPEAPVAPAEAPTETAAPAEGAEAAGEDSPKLSRRERLGSIFDRLEKGEGEKPAEGAKRDASGKFAKPAVTPGEKTGEKPAKPAAAVKPQPPVKPTIKAPQSWNETQRKEWDALPDSAKTIINQRERQIQKGLQDAAAHAQKVEKDWAPVRAFGENFAKMIQPYRALMEQEAAQSGRRYDPLTTVSSLLQTAANLRHHDRRVGAGVLAQVMQTYGFDSKEGIELIVAALEGKGLQPGQRPQPGPQAPQQIDPEAILRQAEERVMKRFQGMQAESAQAEAESETADFASTHEHFEAVRERMADLVEMNARRMEALPPGERVALDLEQAYRVACLSDPEVAPLFQQAEVAAPAAPAAAKPAPVAQPKPLAASSIRSKPGGSARAPAEKPKSRREGLAQLLAAREGQQ
jgi:hypothetical protein